MKKEKRVEKNCGVKHNSFQMSKIIFKYLLTYTIVTFFPVCGALDGLVSCPAFQGVRFYLKCRCWLQNSVLAIYSQKVKQKVSTKSAYFKNILEKEKRNHMEKNT